jgi:murein tripeptide amidase MpaA
VWLEAGNTAPLVFAEAKKQGPAGNAIERWYKNFAIAKALQAEVFLTVCTGEGFFENRTAQSTLETALALDPDERHRFTDDTVWNHPVGRVWLFRFETAADATPAALSQLCADAIAHARHLRHGHT